MKIASTVSLASIALTLALSAIPASASEEQSLYQFTQGRSITCQDEHHQVVMRAFFHKPSSSLEVVSSAYGDDDGDVQLTQLKVTDQILFEMEPASGDVFSTRVIFPAKFTGILECSEGTAAVYAGRDFTGSIQLQSSVACCLDGSN